MKKAAILAAGKGSRLNAIGPYKPLVLVNGSPLLELTLSNLHFEEFKNIAVIFNDDEKEMNLSLLPSLNKMKIDYFFKSTVSSMHSLLEVSKKLHISQGEHIFVSMVDSVVLPHEALQFQEFCRGVAPGESAIMVTPHIDDEKPLTLMCNPQGYVTEFQCAADAGALITSGVYYLSAEALSLLPVMIKSGKSQMRNYLSELIGLDHKIKAYKVPKTLDVDRPEDIKRAEAFLRGE